MIRRVEIDDRYTITVENDSDEKQTTLGVDRFNLVFTTKDQVESHIRALQRALEFWEYEQEGSE